MLLALRRNLWNWLPAFLEIAEAGSIVAAARRLALTPAAVSRTLGLLEDALGVPVFNRVGKTLVLNAAGAALRDAVREATRTVDVGLSETLGDPFLGPLRVASLGVLTDLVMPSVIELKREYRDLVPEHLNIGPADANTLLVRGRLEVAFYYEEITAETIVVERIGQLRASIYCGRMHPLFKKRKVTPSRHPRRTVLRPSRRRVGPRSRWLACGRAAQDRNAHRASAFEPGCVALRDAPDGIARCDRRAVRSDRRAA